MKKPRHWTRTDRQLIRRHSLCYPRIRVQHVNRLLVVDWFNKSYHVIIIQIISLVIVLMSFCSPHTSLLLLLICPYTSVCILFFRVLTSQLTTSEPLRVSLNCRGLRLSLFILIVQLLKWDDHVSLLLYEPSHYER